MVLLRIQGIDKELSEKNPLVHLRKDACSLFAMN